MGEMAMGGSPRFGKLVQFCCLMYTTGSCISYVILTADFLVGKVQPLQFVSSVGKVQPFIVR
jgi:hypothetical protein